MLLVAVMSWLVYSQISPVFLMMQVNSFGVSAPYSVMSQIVALPFGVFTSRLFLGS